jgi:hypothetical protein
MAPNTFEATLRTLFEYYRDFQADSRLAALAEKSAKRYGIKSSYTEKPDDGASEDKAETTHSGRACSPPLPEA